MYINGNICMYMRFPKRMFTMCTVFFFVPTHCIVDLCPALQRNFYGYTNCNILLQSNMRLGNHPYISMDILTFFHTTTSLVGGPLALS